MDENGQTNEAMRDFIAETILNVRSVEAECSRVIARLREWEAAIANSQSE